MWNIREESVESSVPVGGCETMQRCADSHVLKDRHSLAVGREHWCIVVVVSNGDFNVRRVDMSRVSVLDIDGHVVEQM